MSSRVRQHAGAAGHYCTAPPLDRHAISRRCCHNSPDSGEHLTNCNKRGAAGAGVTVSACICGVRRAAGSCAGWPIPNHQSANCTGAGHIAVTARCWWERWHRDVKVRLAGDARRRRPKRHWYPFSDLF